MLMLMIFICLTIKFQFLFLSPKINKYIDINFNLGGFTKKKKKNKTTKALIFKITVNNNFKKKNRGRDHRAISLTYWHKTTSRTKTKALKWPHQQQATRVGRSQFPKNKNKNPNRQLYLPLTPLPYRNGESSPRSESRNGGKILAVKQPNYHNVASPHWFSMYVYHHVMYVC